MKSVPISEKRSRLSHLIAIFRDAFQSNGSTGNAEIRELQAQYFGLASSGDARWQLASLAAARRNLF